MFGTFAVPWCTRVLTDVPAVIQGYGTRQAEPIRTIDADTLAQLPFPAVGPLTEAADVLAGHAGTTITRASSTADPA